MQLLVGCFWLAGNYGAGDVAPAACRRHITELADARSGASAAERSWQEPVVDQVLVSGLVTTYPASALGGAEELVEVGGDVVFGTRPSDHGEDGPDEVGG